MKGRFEDRRPYSGHFARYAANQYSPKVQAGRRDHDAEYNQYLKNKAKANKKSEESSVCSCFGWFQPKDKNGLDSGSENETLIFLPEAKKGSGSSKL